MKIPKNSFTYIKYIYDNFRSMIFLDLRFFKKKFLKICLLLIENQDQIINYWNNNRFSSCNNRYNGNIYSTS